MFFCDPPGITTPDALFNYGVDTIEENDYVFFHDQEPVDPELYQPLFHDVLRRNQDINSPRGHVLVSELGATVNE